MPDAPKTGEAAPILLDLVDRGITWKPTKKRLV
jgi:hypothetical protein